MASIIRALGTYLFLLLVFRSTGKRSLAEITSFDAVLLLIISEAIQQALIDTDNSMTNAFLIVLTLVGADLVLQKMALHSERVDKLLNGAPLVLVEEGKVLHDRMKNVRVSEDDIMEAARAAHGLERLDQVKYAVLERSGGITVVPRHVPWKTGTNDS
jgi:uncharacterized membrane protein YcaP (DUF421 family)